MAADDPHKGAPTLLPCPFCGSTDLLGDATAVYEGKVDSQTGWYECKACGCTGPSAEVANIGMEPAREIWNKRAAQAQESPAVIAEIAAERRRQVEVEGWTAQYDDDHRFGELADAAACYAINAGGNATFFRQHWPWDLKWWKPTNPRRDLIKAAALIVAEIERLDRERP